MDASEIREKYLKFFEKRGHKIIPPAPLVLENDPTTLFTSSGMQPLIPYLMGQKHPMGVRLVNSQPAIRTQDIDEVGDNRHTTFFEMLGNWSLGDYFKKDQLPWIWEFLTEELGLPKEKLYVSIFEGNKDVPRDEESYNLWISLGVSKDHIFEYDVKKNWWSRSGTPDQMPVGEIGGPDSEIFFEFTEVKHSKEFGEKCHPNCDCGRFLEIGNSVFIQYKKTEKGLEELPQKNVDFGGGLERLVMATMNEPDIYKTSVLEDLRKSVEKKTGVSYQKSESTDRNIRIVAEHVRAASALIGAGVIPSNKLQGYVLRRLIRRAAIKMRKLQGDLSAKDLNFDLPKEVSSAIEEEISKFTKTLSTGLKEIEKIDKIDGKKAFDLYQSFGFPLEITLELAQEKGQKVDVKEFKKAFEEHQEKSRSQSAGVFKGGLADHSEEVTRLHTAHHLLLASLQKLIDPSIRQKGSNITADRLRIDINFDRKLTESEIKEVEDLINEKVNQNLRVVKKTMLKEDAEKLGAQMEFGAKYPERVSVFIIGPQHKVKVRNIGKIKMPSETREITSYFSAEFCGGPHVANTKEIGHVKITKQEKLGAGVIRFYATNH